MSSLDNLYFYEVKLRVCFANVNFYEVKLKVSFENFHFYEVKLKVNVEKVNFYEVKVGFQTSQKDLGGEEEGERRGGGRGEQL